MIGIFRAAVQGMLRSRDWTDVIGQNLSNIDMVGYKRNRAEFQDLLYQQLPDTQNGPGPVLSIGGGANLQSTQRMFVQGTLQPTSSPTDMAIFGDGFFPVEMSDGTTAYTRNGNFRVDEDGGLVTASGQRLASPITTIPTGFETFQVDGAGHVLITLPDSPDKTSVGQIELARFGNVLGLESIGGGFWRASNASGPPETGNPGDPRFGQVQAGTLEQSTVSLQEEMTDLLQAQRAYQFSSRALTTLDSMVGRIIQMRQ